MQTTVVAIMHYIYATFHVHLMQGSEVMNQNLSKSVGFLIFSAGKIVTNQDFKKNLKKIACSCGCLLAYKTHMSDLMYDIEVMNPYVSNLRIFQQKKPIIFVKNTDFENTNTWARR